MEVIHVKVYLSGFIRQSQLEGYIFLTVNSHACI